jgi:hypothetical protein
MTAVPKAGTGKCWLQSDCAPLLGQTGIQSAPWEHTLSSSGTIPETLTKPCTTAQCSRPWASHARIVPTPSDATSRPVQVHMALFSKAPPSKNQLSNSPTPRQDARTRECSLAQQQPLPARLNPSPAAMQRPCTHTLCQYQGVPRPSMAPVPTFEARIVAHKWSSCVEADLLLVSG